ncbi:MAG: hypothetical protein JXB24_05650 [Bacteroidales bacterium]|nr:hypothetical protein [Bacteroidales bacterium]
MKTLTNIRAPEKHVKVLLMIVFLVFQVTLKASELLPEKKEVVETKETVEDWMLDLSTWAKNTNSFVLTEETEKELEIEDWMVNPKDEIWNNRDEEERKIEEWMFDVNHCYWDDFATKEKEMPIEKWMVNISDWSNDEVLLSTVVH